MTYTISKYGNCYPPIKSQFVYFGEDRLKIEDTKPKKDFNVLSKEWVRKHDKIFHDTETED